MIKNKAGIWGELYAVRWLRDRGYDIISSNYTCRVGEIDIVASDGKMLFFVEVKTREASTDRRPMEAVDEFKTERMKKAAGLFMSSFELDLPSRFDVAEVYISRSGESFSLVDINYIEGAFGA